MYLYFNYICEIKIVLIFSYLLPVVVVVFLGIMLNRQSPPISTPLEPCRIAPYVNLATSRNVSNVQHSVGSKSVHTSSSESSDNQNGNGSLLPGHSYLRTVSKSATMSAFDPAIISAAAHKVCTNWIHMFTFK